MAMVWPLPQSLWVPAPSASNNDAINHNIINDSAGSARMDQVMIWEADPDEWSYVAEGGKHALFRYRGADIGLSGHLLRIAKNKLARVSTTCNSCGGWDSTTSTKISTTSMIPKIPAIPVRADTTIASIDDTASQEFQRQIIQPLLCHRYIDLARTVHLPAYFCAQLYHRTLANGLIPPSRVPSWKSDVINHDTTVDINEGVNALLLRDHTHISRHRRLSSLGNNTPSSSVVLSVEIKPKAGYISSSPLVLPAHRCKYYRTRYSLQQELMQMGQIHKGWRRSRSRTRVDEACEQDYQSTEGSNIMHDEAAFIPSNYSPLDLFSNNTLRMQKALVDLSCNMQNNFRVWCNGNQIFGVGASPPTDSDCQIILQDIFPSFGDDSNNDAVNRPNLDSKATLLDVIVATVTKILDKESSLLSNMLSVQQLDWIDGDGAAIIYERLVHLCNGSNSEVEALLDAAVLIPGDAFSSTWKEFATSDNNDWRSKHSTSSPYMAPKCNALPQLLDEIHHFQSYREQQRRYDSSFDEVCDNSHFKCIEFVNKLSKDACIYLLQNWLLSLSLCDVSFFVTFRFLNEFNAVDGALKDVRQTCDHGGIVYCSMQNNNGELSTRRDIAVEYEVKVIDCDPKPAKKLRDRREVEDAFRFVSKKRIDDVDEQVG